MTYTVLLGEKAENEDLPFLDSSIEDRILAAVRDKLAVEPIRFSKPLQHQWKGHRSLRVGDYRIIYGIDPRKNTVYIVTIGHRSGVYEQ